MKKIESLCKEIEDIKKNQVEFLELKKCNNQNKKFSGYSQLQNEGYKELVNWEIETIEIIHLDNIEKIDWKEINRASGTWGTITKDLTSMPLPIWKDKGERTGKKLFKEKWLKTSQIWPTEKKKKKTNLQIRKSDWIPNKISLKKSMWRYITIKILKTKAKKKKNLESSKRKSMPYIYRKNKLNDGRFLTKNYEDQKEVAQ